jgi:hypothetical protein
VQYGPQYGHGYAFPHPAPPDPPERPEGIPGYPRWPVWYGPAAFGIGLVGTLVAATIVAVIDRGELGPTGLLVATVLQGIAFMGAALLFAARTERPRAAHFGLRRARFWPTLGWAALGYLAYWIAAAVYSLFVGGEADQQVLDELHVDDSTLRLVAASALVIVVAPIAEEFFFRGFFYRALRTRLTVWVAALLDGVLFGLIHAGGTDLKALPVLAVLGFIFCLVYERTGTLFAPIGLHALNNTLVMGVVTEEWGVTWAVGGTMLAACMVVPRMLDQRA